MTSSQRVTHVGHDANGVGRYGDRTHVTDWSMAITVKRYETEKRHQSQPQVPGPTKSRCGRPASDEFILRAVSAKSSRQASASAATLRTRPKVNSTAADMAQSSRSRTQQHVTSSSNKAVDIGQSSLVIKPAINQNGEVHRLKDSLGLPNRNTDFNNAKRPTRHRNGTSRDQSIDQSRGGTNMSLTTQAKTLDIFLPLLRVTENDN